MRSRVAFLLFGLDMTEIESGSKEITHIYRMGVLYQSLCFKIELILVLYILSNIKEFIPVYWRLLLCYIILHDALCSRKGWSVSFTNEGLQRENQLLANTG